MKTENVLSTEAVERVGILSIVRTIDFQKLAEESTDGRIDVDLLTEGGDFGVKVQPTGRGKDPVTFGVPDLAAAESFVAGFHAAVNLRKRAAKSNGASDIEVESADDLALFTKAQLVAYAQKHEVGFKQQWKKAKIVEAIVSSVFA